MDEWSVPDLAPNLPDRRAGRGQRGQMPRRTRRGGVEGRRKAKLAPLERHGRPGAKRPPPARACRWRRIGQRRGSFNTLGHRHHAKRRQEGHCLGMIIENSKCRWLEVVGYRLGKGPHRRRQRRLRPTKQARESFRGRPGRRRSTRPHRAGPPTVSSHGDGDCCIALCLQQVARNRCV